MSLSPVYPRIAGLLVARVFTSVLTFMNKGKGACLDFKRSDSCSEDVSAGLPSSMKYRSVLILVIPK